MKTLLILLVTVFFSCTADQRLIDDFERFQVSGFMSNGYGFYLVCDKATGAEYLFRSQSGGVTLATKDCRLTK